MEPKISLDGQQPAGVFKSPAPITPEEGRRFFVTTRLLECRAKTEALKGVVADLKKEISFLEKHIEVYEGEIKDLDDGQTVFKGVY